MARSKSNDNCVLNLTGYTHSRTIERMIMSEDLHDKFEAVNDDYRKFERVENKRSNRPDLHAFLVLDEIFPSVGRDIVAAASHDVIYLEVEGDNLVRLMDSEILELVRCGVMYDGESDCLSMFT